MDARDLARKLDELADRVARIQPLNEKPESYFVERDEIRAELRKLAASLSARPADARAPRGRFTAGSIEADGRRIAVERRGHRKPRLPTADCRLPTAEVR